MKIVSFDRGGSTGFGALQDDRIVDLTGAIAGTTSVRDLLGQPGWLDSVRGIVDSKPASFAYTDCTLLPVIPNPSKIICVGLNYKAHAAEAGREVSKYPVIFHRFADTLVADREPLVQPRVSSEFDYEGELAVVISRDGGHIAKADAMTYVAGYACFNESSVRDWQFHTHQYGMGKNFKGTGAFGPFLVTADEIPDYTELTLKTVLNGEVLQQGSLDQLIFDIPSLISYVSDALPWRAGDVLVTGTPSGIGFKRKPPIYLKPGDTVSVEIPRVGTLTNPVEAEA